MAAGYGQGPTESLDADDDKEEDPNPEQHEADAGKRIAQMPKNPRLRLPVPPLKLKVEKTMSMTLDDLAAEMLEKSGSLKPDELRAVGAKIEQEHAQQAQQPRRLSKALVGYETGEPVSGADMGHMTLAVGSPSPSGDQHFGGSSDGMGSVDEGETVMFTADDPSTAEAMSDHEYSLARGSQGGASQLVSSVGETDLEGNAAPHGTIPMMAKGYQSVEWGHTADDVARYYAIEQRRLERAAEPGAEELTFQPMMMAKARPMGPGMGQPEAPLEVSLWSNNASGGQASMLFSDFEDKYIERELEKGGGYIREEPVIGMPHTLLTRSVECGMCKSQHPAMFTSCPNCSHDHTMPVMMGGTAVMEKSVANFRRPPADDDLLWLI